MEERRQFAPGTGAKPETDFFEFQAEAGITKHLGGTDATDALIEYCHIGDGSHVLDAGCGVGLTPIYLAQRYDCTVVGVDIRSSMIARASQRARQAHLADKVRFQLADVRKLPFEDDMFNAVICESVLAFVEDKAQALNEYVRVTKPGGYIGLNETIWAKRPTPELLDFVTYAGAQVKLLDDEDMKALLRNGGLEIIAAQPYTITAKAEALTQIERLGWRNMFRIWGRTLRLFFTRPDYRELIRYALGTPKELAGYMGYGLYVSRKPSGPK